MILYGRLAGQDPLIDQSTFSQKDLRLETFSITRWFERLSLPEKIQHALHLQEFSKKYVGTNVLGTVSLHQLIHKWQEYEKQSGTGKYLLDPFKSY